MKTNSYKSDGTYETRYDNGQLETRRTYKDGLYDGLKEETYKGYTISVFYDEDASPLDFDNLGTIFSNHRRYNACGHTIDEIIEETEDGCEVNSNYISIPIYYYEHSGITICSANRFTDKWDSGLFGLYAVPKEKIIKEFGSLSEESINLAKTCLIDEIDNIWRRYYEGEIYGLIIKDKNGKKIECIGGYYTDEDEIIDDAKSIIDYEVEKKDKLEMICEPFWID